jgi:hypothetical protein
MSGMTGVDLPPRVRSATTMTWLAAPAGLLLVAVGLLELHWWGTPEASRLTELLSRLQAQYGFEPPVLLRGRGGAVELIVLGLAGLACAALAPWLAKGLRWARTAVMVLAGGTFLVGLTAIGTDLFQPQDLRAYFSQLTQQSLGGRIAEVQALVYPGWYPWLEDVAQGLQVLVLLAIVVALAWAAIVHPGYFVSRKAAQAAPDDWDDVISRLHQKSAGDPTGAERAD